MEIKIVGGGLAGAEAAYQIATRGISVRLFEMRPRHSTPAHRTGLLAELVCSNSLKSREVTNAHGLLKEELRRLGSLIVKCADETAVPGGKALVVDRNRFAEAVTEKVTSHPLVEVVEEEVKEIPEGAVLIATGPLTSDAFSESLRGLTGEDGLYFFDAISPILDRDSIDMERAFFGSRYMDGVEDYLNCPLSEEEYEEFYGELLKGVRVDFRDFEKTPYFEACLPIEVMAERGKQTLLYGPMKPVGLVDRRTGREPFAVVQLRRENVGGTMYNMVGFQTKLTYSEQERIFHLIPALKKAAFLRYGSIHRNTYINGPKLLNDRLQLRGQERLFLAGQITGVEGYVESAAMGFIAGVSASLAMKGENYTSPPGNTCIGALVRYITAERENFQPMNINFGLLEGYRKREKRSVVEKALLSIEQWRETVAGDRN
jgi:methylenetetrahydrofolate--tRNA-(uracil-5-)-methyltransferase